MGIRFAGFGLRDDAFVVEVLVCVFEGFAVDGFEVGEVALVVEGFAKELGFVEGLFGVEPDVVVYTGTEGRGETH